ncbi:DUF6950 family protein [Methylobacterium frigidaeris]|nr:hypothetical protein [Methylobacterium frigidaeris]
MSPTLVRYLREAAGQPFAWGSLDCSLFMAGWVRARTGIDPAAALRGRYATERGALRLARRLGGMEAVARRQMAAAGFATTCEPVPGDVGIIAHPCIGPTCAVLTEYGWAIKSLQGVAVVRFPAIISWSLA